MPIGPRIICLFLAVVSSTAFAEVDTLSEADQYKAEIRLAIWQKTLHARLLARADIAIGYLDLGDESIQESVCNEMGFSEEEHERWINAKNVELLQSFEADLKPIGKQFETIKSLDEFDALVAEADRLIYERAGMVQTQILEEVGPERLAKLRKLGLQLNPLLAENGVIDFKAYEFLDLTEEQRKQLEALHEQSIKGLDEWIKETGNLYEQFVDLELDWGKKGEEAVKENEALIQAEAKKLEEKGEKAEGKFQEVAKSVRLKISLLLTPKQTEQLEKIIAETPTWLQSKKEDSPKADSWKDAWKPGDPVPEGRSQPKERKAFPLKVM